MARLRLTLLSALIAGSVTISASPADAVAGFGDVGSDRYFTEPVQWMVDNEITTGTSATCFSPGDHVTRAQAGAFLWRMEGEPPADPHPFDDVVRDWQQGPVSWLHAEAITTGTGADTFTPDGTLTRGQFAALLHRLAGEPTAAEPHPFVDVTTPWQEEPVAWLFEEEITKGTSADEFSPDDPVTRGQIATFLYRYVGSPLVTVDPTHPITPTCGQQVVEAGTGFESLFIGHSFFRPMAEAMAVHAPGAGFTGHEQTVVFSGGATGSPQGLWEQDDKRGEIQAALDTGDVELFGMTYHPAFPTMEGYRNWVDYALAANPDTVFFVAMPWLTDPGTYDAATYDATMDAMYDFVAKSLIDNLRGEYPGVDFFAIPYGLGAAELYSLWDAGELPDVSEFVGSNGSGIFRDDFGHADQILVDLSTLVWLRAIYGVDLTTYDHGYDWPTDLAAIATEIMDSHDPAYNAP